MDSNPVVDIDTDKDVLLLLFFYWVLLLKIWDNNYSQLIVAITKTSHNIEEKLAKSSREKN